MKKRVFIIHGWDGYPEEGWFPWLKKELEQKGFEVFVPAMPNSAEPKIEEWITFLANIVGESGENTYFVGHSIGCQTILRFLETINKKIGGVVFVAGWFILSSLELEENKKLFEEKLNAKILIEHNKGHFSGSDNVIELPVVLDSILNF